MAGGRITRAWSMPGMRKSCTYVWAPVTFVTTSGRGLPELNPGNLDGEAAPRRPLVRRERRVALDQLHSGERDVQLLGHHLGQGDADARPDVHLARVHRDRAVLSDGEEGIHLVER